LIAGDCGSCWPAASLTGPDATRRAANQAAAKDATRAVIA
jgi:hypothetical protein